LGDPANRRKSLQVAAVKPDYYEVLGVPHDADEETIRRAFRALARDCHPDVSDEPEDHRRFRELAEAYGVLSRPASRLLYDRYGYRALGNQLFEVGSGDAAPLPRGENVHARIELRPCQAKRGAARLMRYDAPTLCEVCDGRGVVGESGPAILIARILGIESPTCGVETCDDCDGTGLVESERRVRVRIPPGVEDGDRVRVRGAGGHAGDDGVPGDLLVDITVVPVPGDSPAVRYLALAGALAAAVLLIAYLLLA
jgi:molecular chaperone DnaJ